MLIHDPIQQIVKIDKAIKINEQVMGNGLRRV